jgi:hypothetical protein
MAKSTTSTSTSSPRRRTTKKPNGGTLDGPNGTQPPRPEVTEDDIRTRAYHRYLERGGSDGGDFDDWLEAERELKLPRHN